MSPDDDGTAMAREVESCGIIRVHPKKLTSRRDRYNQSHAPLHEQDAIYGHSVRAFYLTTAAADLGGEFMNDAKRLYDNAVDAKMYVTGGFGSEPRVSSE
jgi:DUF1680 family protein